MHEYRINIDKKVLRLLGAQLYGDTPSIISELVQNAYDADAHNVWITLDTKGEQTIIVEDDGIGMTPSEVNTRFLNIGHNRRDNFPTSPSGRKVLGRKGIGKLAVFSLAKIVDVYSRSKAKKENDISSTIDLSTSEVAACRLDFDLITLHDGNPISLPDGDTAFIKEHLSMSTPEYF